MGAAGNTKRPTSVVMIAQTATKKKADGAEDTEDWSEVYLDLVKVVNKAGRDVKI